MLFTGIKVEKFHSQRKTWKILFDVFSFTVMVKSFLNTFESLDRNDITQWHTIQQTPSDLLELNHSTFANGIWSILKGYLPKEHFLEVVSICFAEMLLAWMMLLYERVNIFFNTKCSCLPQFQ